MKIIKWLKWLLKGKPMIYYEGFHCGICGRWTFQPFELPEYKSDGEWWDTWGVCEKCREIKNS